MYICLKCTQFLKFNADNSLSVPMCESLGKHSCTSSSFPLSHAEWYLHFPYSATTIKCTMVFGAKNYK